MDKRRWKRRAQQRQLAPTADADADSWRHVLALMLALRLSSLAAAHVSSPPLPPPLPPSDEASPAPAPLVASASCNTRLLSRFANSADKQKSQNVVEFAWFFSCDSVTLLCMFGSAVVFLKNERKQMLRHVSLSEYIVCKEKASVLKN